MAQGGAPIDRREALLRGLGLTLPAAVAGTFLGAVLFWLVTMIPGASRPFSHDGDLFALGFLLLFALPATLFAWPGLILLGFPLSWPFRRRIVRHPFVAGAALVLIGGSATTLLSNWLDGNSAFPDPATNASLCFSYAGATAAVWVAALHRCRNWLEIGAGPRSGDGL